jgi:hypothetical protein
MNNLGLGLRLGGRGAGETLGDELLTNGGFDTADNWSTSAQCSVSGGEAHIVSADGSYQYVRQSGVTVSVEIGKTYRVTIEISAVVSGGVKLSYGNFTGLYVFPASVGVHTADLVATGDGSATFSLDRNSGVTDVSVTSISMREVL